MTFYQKDRERALLYLTKLMDKGKPVKIEQRPADVDTARLAVVLPGPAAIVAQ